MAHPGTSAPVPTAPPLFEDGTEEFRAALQRHADRLDLPLIDRALRFSASAHRGQKRMSGDDFISHSVAVASILADQLLDSTSIAAALLHDVVEDSDVSTADIEDEFGSEIAGIVDGLTKIAHLTFRSSAEEQVENYRKLLLSIARDARVIIIKLADRLHNMRTLGHLPEDRRSRIALETREIYAPLAHRFGMAGSLAADACVTGILGGAASIAGYHRLYALQPFEDRLHAPEAATGEHRRLLAARNRRVEARCGRQLFRSARRRAAGTQQKGRNQARDQATHESLQGAQCRIEAPPTLADRQAEVRRRGIAGADHRNHVR